MTDSEQTPTTEPEMTPEQQRAATRQALRSHANQDTFAERLRAAREVEEGKEA